MDKEKQIEEITRILCGGNCNECCFSEACKIGESAILLSNAGYGHIPTAIKEFSDWVIDLIFTNSVIDEGETRTAVVETPEYFQEKILAKVEECRYGNK